MQVQQFIQALETHADRPLLFEYRSGQTVQGGYHVTEIKNASFETIDCGNSLHTWKEVIIQVWVPDEAGPDEAPMSTGKFLKIWQTVNGRIPLFQDGEVRIEYNDPAHLTAVYHVDDLRVTEAGVRVVMAPPRTLCKPRDILIPLNGYADSAAGCCAPTNPVHEGEQVIPLPVAEASTGCC